MDAFVCLDVHHDHIVSILSEKYVCTHHNPDDLGKNCSSPVHHNVLSMMSRKPTVVVYRHVDTLNNVPVAHLRGERVLFTVKSAEIPRELAAIAGGLHNMFLYEEYECEHEHEHMDGRDDYESIVKYAQHTKKSGVTSLSKCRNYSDIVSFITRKPKYRKEFMNDFLFLSICMDVVK